MAPRGLEEVLKAFTEKIKQMQAGAEQGLIKAGVIIRSESQRECPVDTSNLINSCYGPDLFKTLKGPVAEVGYTAMYAPYVHEMIGAHFQKAGSKAKFLEDPLKRNEKRIFEILAECAKIS